MPKSVFTKENLCWVILSVVLFGVLTLLMQAGIINSYYRITLFNICINIMLAVSLNLVIGICGQFSLGHAGFMCIGAYSAGVITKMIPNYGGLLLGILVGFAISAVAALIVSVPTLRLKGDYLAIATLGFAEIIRILVQNMTITNGAAG
ncbi:branched-chain amino acid ABC transporter permease, partial [Faecalibaculum rodentium]